MTAPSKPWEMSNYRMTGVGDTRIFNSAGPGPLTTNITGLRSSPPALPPRPYQQTQSVYGSAYGNTYGSYGGAGGGGYMGNYGVGYGGYSAGFGGYNGGYGSLGYGSSYGGSYNRLGGMYGPGINMEGRFIQIAEENCRPAFQSIQSVVGAFGGIAAMLDSTFMAMTSSFRAILGVADNFGRLRSLFAQFWSTFAIIRSINWLYRKVLSFLGISKYDPQKAQAWADALSGENNQDRQKGSSWPILVFLGIIISAPYIIIKLLGGLNRSIIDQYSDPVTWTNSQLACVLYDIQNPNQGELPIRTSQNIKIAPMAIQNSLKLMNTGWLLASTDNKTSGLVPVNYIKVLKENRHIPQSNVEDMSKQDIQNVDTSQGHFSNTSLVDIDSNNISLEQNITDRNTVDEQRVTFS